MSMWRCPHCGTPQVETARCWVCHRSSTTCSTCRHFRRGVAAQLGYCGLDRRHLPLVGTELRGCWEAGPMKAPEPIQVETLAERAQPSSRLRDFVPVTLARGPASRAAMRPEPAATPPVPPVGSLADGGAGSRVTLFGDAET